MIFWAFFLACAGGKAVLDSTDMDSHGRDPESSDSGAGQTDTDTDDPPDDDQPPDDSGQDSDTGDGPLPTSVTLSGGSVWDRYLSEPMTWEVLHSGPGDLIIDIVDEDGTSIATLDAPDEAGVLTWDGLTADAVKAPLGQYTVQAAMIDNGDVLASSDLPLDVVRVGINAIRFTGPKVGLVWHRMAGPGTYYAADPEAPHLKIDHIDDSDAAHSFPPVWDDLEKPPDDDEYNTPAAYVWNETPTMSVVLDGLVFEQPIEIAIAAWSTDDATFQPSSSLSFTSDTTLSDGPGIVEDNLTITYASDGVIFAQQDIPVRLYALLDQPGWDSADIRYLPWLAVIDPALRTMPGVEPDPDAVTAELVTFIYRDLELSYDTRWGASSYVSYESRGYDDAHFDMTSFLERGRGSVINCTDAAAILQGYANMLGVDLDYAIVNPGFDLNYIKAIGGEDFSHCPFGGGGCGFSYHAVTTMNDAETIFDATLALDGDADPSSAPHEELLVQSIEGDEYLWRLVMSGSPDYRHIQKGTIQ